MGVKVKEWKGAFWIFNNHHGQRKAKRVGTGPAGKKAAELAAIKIQDRMVEGETAIFQEAAPPPITFRAYAHQWLEMYAAQACKFSTARTYELNLRRLVLPVLGTKPVAAMLRSDCRLLIAACRTKGLSPKTIENICRTLSSMLSQAVEEWHSSANPAFRLGRYYRKGDHPKPPIHPLTPEEVQRFLVVARQQTPREFPLFLCAVRTELRLGELLALQWGDIDVHGRFLEVRRNLVVGRITTPKNGKIRRVDMSAQLTEVLKGLLLTRKEETLRKACGEVPEWVFCNELGRRFCRIFSFPRISGMISLWNLRRREGEPMISSKGAHFAKDIILTCVRWYVAYPLSYRQLEKMMQERGASVDHSTINRWVLKYSPQCEEAFHRRKRPVYVSWRMDETYIRLRGQWHYLYRAVDKAGQTIDFLLTAHRDKPAAKRFLAKAIQRHGVPETITIDGSEANAAAVRHDNTAHKTAIKLRQVRYLNNVVEQDHRAVKRITHPMLGFKPVEAAQYTLAGVELMHMLRKGQWARWSRAGSDSGRTVLCTSGIVTTKAALPSSPLKNCDIYGPAVNVKTY